MPYSCTFAWLEQRSPVSDCLGKNNLVQCRDFTTTLLLLPFSPSFSSPNFNNNIYLCHPSCLVWMVNIEATQVFVSNSGSARLLYYYYYCNSYCACHSPTALCTIAPILYLNKMTRWVTSGSQTKRSCIHRGRKDLLSVRVDWNCKHDGRGGYGRQRGAA